MFKQRPKPRKGVLSRTWLACALYVGASPTLADETNPSLPTAMPAMAGPLILNPNPTIFNAGSFGNVFITGALTGLALSQGNATAGDSGALVDLTNAQVFAQKTDGVVQFFIQGGGYSLPAVGIRYVNAIQTT
jgi:hypothetical protein